MKIEIDQSGKVEYTSQPTVIAFTNSKKATAYISAKSKRMIQQYFREKGYPQLYVYRTFTAIIYLLIKPYLKEITHIIIDTEYKGHEKSLREMLLEYIQKNNSDDALSITFRRIGNKPLVHYLANNTFNRRIAPTIRLTAKEVIEIAKKKDRGSES